MIDKAKVRLLKLGIEKVIQKYTPVGYCTLIDRLKVDYGIDATGDRDFVAGEDDNVYFWTDVSKEFIEAILELSREGYMKARPAQPLEILMDGGALNFPKANPYKFPKGGKYKTPHWCPVVLVKVEPQQKAK